MAFVILCFAIFLFTFIVPRFAELHGSLGVELPLITKIVFGLGGFFSTYWWFSVLLLLTLGVGIPLGKRYPPTFLLAWDGWKLNYPIFGELNKMLALSRFTHTQ